MTSERAHQPHLLRGILLIMLAVFLFSAMDTLAKFTLRSYPMGPLIWARYSVHTVFMLTLLAPRMGLSLVRTSRPGPQVTRGLLLGEHRLLLLITAPSPARRGCCHLVRGAGAGDRPVWPHAE